MPAWPNNLPLRVHAHGYTEQRLGNVSRTPMEVGPAKTRKRSAATRYQYRITLEFEHSNLNAWNAFLETINAGSNAFTWTHPVKHITEVRIIVPNGGVSIRQIRLKQGPDTRLKMTLKTVIFNHLLTTI